MSSKKRFVMNSFRELISQTAVFMLLIGGECALIASPRHYISKETREGSAVHKITDHIQLDQESDNVYRIITELIKWDRKSDSLLHELKKHIEKSSSVWEYRDITKTFEYAQSLLHARWNEIGAKESTLLAKKLHRMFDQIMNKQCGANTHHTECCVQDKSEEKVFPRDYIHDYSDKTLTTKFLIVKKEAALFGLLKAYGESKFYKHAHFKHNVTFSHDVKFKENVKFKDDVVFEDDVKFKDEVEFKDDVTFDENVTIEGDLIVEGTVSINDIVIVGTIADIVINNLSVDNAVIEDLTVLNCMDSLCVNDFTANDAIIDNATINNLSVLDTIVITGCIDDLCVVNFSADNALIINATIQNLSATNEIVQNLSVVNCMDSLCVLDFSATNATIDTLTATDAVIENLTVTTLTATDVFVPDLEVLCDLTVGCNISMVDSVDAAHGNIIKDGARWLHNFPGGGTDNVFLGLNAGNFNITNTGQENIGIGRNALNAITTGVRNTAIGGFAMDVNTIGNDDIAIGFDALGSNTGGIQDIAIGTSALLNNTTGNGNVALGWSAGRFLLVGDNNTILGNGAGFGLAGGNTNIMLGNNAGSVLVTGDNNIYIGNAGANPESGTIRIGTPATHTRAFMQGIFGSIVGGTGIPVVVDAAGQLGTVVSSIKFKTKVNTIQSMESEKIYDLQPVTFVYKEDPSEIKQYGLIAEDVAQVFPELVVSDSDGKPFTVRYQLLPILLLNEIQRLHNVTQEQGMTINVLKADNKKMGKILERIMEQLEVSNN